MFNLQGLYTSVLCFILCVLDIINAQYILHTSGGNVMESPLLKILQETGNAIGNDMDDLSPNWNTQQKGNEVYDDYEPHNGLIFTKRRPEDPVFSGEYETRDFSEEAVVDLLVIVDYVVYQDFLEKYENNRKKAVRSIKRYYQLLVNLIDSRFKDIKGLDVTLRIRPVSIIIVEEKPAFEWSADGLRDWESTDRVKEKVLDPHVALKDLQSWLVKQKGLPQYDHAMAFTGYTLVKNGKSKPLSGLAYISTICQTDVGFSISVIAETGGFNNVGTAAHELAHSLGASHDGNEENQDCPVELGYIMTPSVSMVPNHEENYFKFSPCSIKAFHNMIKSNQATCLFDSKHKETYPKLPGEWLTPDKQCRHVYGATSGYCTVPGIRTDEEICHMLWCNDPHDEYGCVTKSGLHAVMGTRCDRNKVCYNGKCVDESSVRPKQKQFSNIHGDNDNGKHNKELESEHYSIKNDALKDYEEKSLPDVKDVIDVDYFESDIKVKDSKDQLKPNPLLNSKTEKLIEQKYRQHTPHIGDRRYLAHNAPKHTDNVQELQRSKIEASTVKQIATTVTPAPSCFEDKSPTYCRDLVYRNGPKVCANTDIAAYCCYSCNFYG